MIGRARGNPSWQIRYCNPVAPGLNQEDAMKNTVVLAFSAVMLACTAQLPAQVVGTRTAAPNVQNVSNAASPALSGTGSPNHIPLWLTSTQLGDSGIFQNGNKLGIGSTKPIAQLSVFAISLIPGFSARGADGPGGSDQSGTHGAVLLGGASDPDSGFAGGGAGVVGIGGLSSELISSGGPGGLFVGGGNAGSGGPGVGIEAICTGSGCLAGYFSGNLHVTGAITAGVKDFKIDHPLDPANKYLLHASVESSEMKNIYDGSIVLDRNGEAVVELPDWFEALNGNFRYQLTAIGVPSPSLYVAQKISGNHFKIAGGTPGAEVSWQVTGVRQDAFAKANPLLTEQAKGEQERGYYLHPELYGESEEKAIDWAHRAPLLRQLKELSAK
jgi:hypothetical protein